MGAGEGAQLLGPAEWRRPAEPCTARPRVGDHPEEPEQHSRSAGKRQGDTAVRRELARYRTDSHEHRHYRDRRQCQIGGTGDGEVAYDRGPRTPQTKAGRFPRRWRPSPTDKKSDAAHIRRGRSLSARRPLPCGTPGLRRELRRPQQRERAFPDTPGAVPADRYNVIGIAVKEPDGVVSGEAAGKIDPICLGRVSAAIGRRFEP